MIIRNVRKLALYPGHFKLINFFAAALAIALLGVYSIAYTSIQETSIICYFTGGKRVKTEAEKEAYTGTYPNCSFDKIIVSLYVNYHTWIPLVFVCNSNIVTAMLP